MIRIANGQGFWGDSLEAPVEQVRRGPIDYLTLDYLAEITMSILQKQRSRDPKAGYARDFVEMIARVLPDLKERRIRVIANAGGVNPVACKDAVLEIAKRQGINVNVAIVAGDDIMGCLDDMIARGVEMKNLDTSEPLSAVRAQVQSAKSHSEWIAQSIREMETIKVGMTRADLLKVFTEEGGLSTRTQRQYVYRECLYIKVAVEFEPVETKEILPENGKDKIVRISKPFIEWSVID